MKLSVVIPVYNEIHTLDAILSKVVQVLPEILKEIIIVDDGSTDGTREWLSQTFGDTTQHSVRVALDYDMRLAPVFANEYEQQDSTAGVAVFQREPVEVKVIFHKRNRGKGGALRTGFQAATGDIVVIQDADLEYDPQDWSRMYKVLAEGWADVVYGSRLYGEPHRVLYFHHLLGNKVISNFINILCNTTLTDIEVCYKMFRREVLEEIKIVVGDILHYWH
jgi:glycosyltransferase involved in cell wall biosynthesis